MIGCADPFAFHVLLRGSNAEDGTKVIEISTTVSLMARKNLADIEMRVRGVASDGQDQRGRHLEDGASYIDIRKIEALTVESDELLGRVVA